MAKRRGNGEGSIRKRKDGRWEGRYTAGHDPVTGKQIFKNVLGKTQAEVRDKLTAAIAEAQKIDVVVSDKMCVCDWMDTWLENFEKPNMRASTYESYEGNIRLHVKPGIGDLTMNKVTTLDLQKFFNALLTEGRIERKESKNKPKGLSVSELEWSRLRITGRRRLAGFFLKGEHVDKNSRNIFYVVFLDKNHEFAPSSRE